MRAYVVVATWRLLVRLAAWFDRLSRCTLSLAASTHNTLLELESADPLCTWNVDGTPKAGFEDVSGEESDSDYA